MIQSSSRTTLSHGCYPKLKPTNYLSDVFHDERAFLYLLESLHSPSTSIVSSKNANAVFTPELYHSVWTLWSTTTSPVTLINGVARRQTNTFFHIIRKVRASIAPTTILPFLVAVGTLTAYNWVRIQIYILTWHVVVDVKKVLHPKYKP
jgi:hypothetical protein